MKRLIVVFMLLGFGSAATAQPMPSDKFSAYLTEMITQLAVLTELASQCGEQLNNYGKDATTGKECAEFDRKFHVRWESRDKLRDEIAELFRVVENGEQPCDDTCAAQVQRIEELRVTNTYYLDYIDFWKEF